MATPMGYYFAPAPRVIFEHHLDATQALRQSDSAIPGRVGEPGWGNAFSQRVSWMVGQQIQSAEFRVEPPQLGPIEVRLSIANDQASLTFAAPHAGARDAIQASLPRLQEILLESGVSLGNVFVGSQMPQSRHDTGARERALGGASADIGTVTGTDPGIVTSPLLGLVGAGKRGRRFEQPIGPFSPRVHKGGRRSKANWPHAPQHGVKL
jgi:flagellar hook-length control protein FliK